MRTRPKLALLAIVLLALALFHSRITRACGPFFPEIIFTNTLHPDLPIGPYTSGDVGVLQSSYSSIYLYVAYHDLTGVPFSPAQQVELWDDNTALTKGEAISRGARLQKENAFQGNAHHKWELEWESSTGWSAGPALAPRQLNFNQGVVPGEGIYKQTAVSESNGWVSYSQFLNCPQDAFHYALTTLQRLSEQFGKSSPGVQGWIQAQQTVFDDCTEGNATPEPLPPSAPAILRQARAYQIAAAHFYSGSYEKSASDFRSIAKDSASPWSTIAPYLVARALVREYSKKYNNRYDMGATQNSASRAALTQAEAQINSVLANPKYARYHHAAQKLRGFIEFRLHPRRRMVELANNMTRISGDANLAQDAIDFKLLLPRVEQRGAYKIPPPIGIKQYSQLADVRAKSDLLDWMFTLRLVGTEAYAHSLEKWEKTHSQAWLVAALMKAAPDSPHLAEVLAAAERVPQASHAYDSLTFYSLRLMLLQGKDAEVRNRLAGLNLNRRRPGGLPPPRSAVNLYLAMRLKLARNLNELFATAARVPALISGDEGDEMPAVAYEPYEGFSSTEARFDNDALMVLNHYLPVAMLAKAVHSKSVPENLRREVALAAWTRAALLGNTAVARSLAPSVETFVPKLAVSVESYNSASTAAARRFAVVLTTLRFPGLVPFVVTPERMTPLDETEGGRYAGNNWWGTEGPLCAPPNPRYPYSQNDAPQWPQIGAALQAIYPGGKVKPPAFLTAREDAEAASEWKRMLAMSPAPDYLSAQVLAWARAHPSDPRVPEALALAVKSTRFGCADPKTGELSKAAFDLLHNRYPKSSWTDKTRYWFNM